MLKKRHVFGWLEWDQFCDFCNGILDFRYWKKRNQFLNYIIKTANNRTKVLQEGSSFWRAQIDCHWQPGKDKVILKAVPFEAKRMMGPPKRIAVPGRLNPKSISFLYLSDIADTAIAEMRPWIGANLTLAELKLSDPKTVIDVTHEEAPATGTPDEEFREKEIWLEISKNVSRPIYQRSARFYRPTQAVAIALRRNGFDGIIYRSSLRPEGYNVALFDTKSVQIVSRTVVTISKVQYQHKKSSQYKIRKDHLEQLILKKAIANGTFST